MQTDGVAVESGRSFDVEADSEMHGTVCNKVVLPVSKRNAPGMASIDPTAIGNR